MDGGLSGGGEGNLAQWKRWGFVDGEDCCDSDCKTSNNRAPLAFINFKYANAAQAYGDEGERNRKQKTLQLYSSRNALIERTYSG